MVISIARQSVILKCKQKRSVLVGNYEFYYIAGFMNKCFGLQGDSSMKPQELLDYILGKLDGLNPKNDEEAYLIKMVSTYEVGENYDSQMVELFDWGATEEEAWQVNTTRQTS